MEMHLKKIRILPIKFKNTPSSYQTLFYLF